MSDETSSRHEVQPADRVTQFSDVDNSDAAVSKLDRRELLRRTAILGAAGVLGAEAFEAAVGTDPASAAIERSSVLPKHPKWNFTIVNHVTTNPFFVPTQYGIQDACASFGCAYQWTGSQTDNVTEMLNALDTAIVRNVDGIGVPIIDPKAFDAPVAKAMDKGIPVIAYNSDAPAGSTNRRLAYVGQDLYQAGQAFGQHIVTLLPKGGHIGLLISVPGSLNVQPRLTGAIAVLKANKKFTYDVVASGPTYDEEKSRVEAYYLGHRKNLAGIFVVDAGTGIGLGELVQKYHITFPTGTFDVSDPIPKYIRSGYLDFGIDQQPYLQGFYTIMELVLFKLSGGRTGPSNIQTGLKFVTKQNVDLYFGAQNRYEGTSSKPVVMPRSGPIYG